MNDRVPYIDIRKAAISKEIAAAIPAALAKRWQIIPLSRHDHRLQIAMVDPTNFYALDDVRLVTGCEIEPVTAAAEEIIRLINEIYGVQEIVTQAVTKLRPDTDALDNDAVKTEDAPAVNIVNLLISEAVKQQASDIHIEPQGKSLRVRFRIDGMLREVFTFPQYTHAAIISRIKIMSEMDIAEKRLPQDGRIKVQEAGRDIDIRVSTIPTVLGEKAVLRILDKQTVVFDVARLGFTERNLRQYQQLYAHARGMILLTGPTGSGKTTTLYATLKAINTSDKNIVTIENPVEYRLDGINQVQVNTKAGLTFDKGLRSILRQDPNVIMVGEIRDQDTAEIAIRAALTGHLVLSTLHTNDAPGAIARLIDMGIEPFLITSSVLGIAAQRLVRLICPVCKQSYQIEPGDAARPLLKVDPAAPIKLFRGAGCSHCHYTGYHGRMAIHEVMVLTPELRKLITSCTASNELAAAAKQAGLQTMWEDGLHKVFAGLTTLDEVRRVAYTETDE